MLVRLVSEALEHFLFIKERLLFDTDMLKCGSFIISLPTVKPCQISLIVYLYIQFLHVDIAVIMMIWENGDYFWL